jgi:hypothetical protein
MKHIVIFLITLFIALTVFPMKMSSPFSQAQFVPNISLIMDFSYRWFNIPGNQWQSYTAIDPDLDFTMCKREFALNYVELAFQSVVDPYFDMTAILAIENNELEVEEAYITTRSLPAGFKIKAGKFLSHFGRLNSKHEHTWNFYDAPLIYQAVFGNDLNDIGMQLNWVAPTDFYLTIGTELFSGENHLFFNKQPFQIGQFIVEETLQPLWVTVIKTSFDQGNFIFFPGMSYALGKMNSNHQQTKYAYSAGTSLLGFDFTMRYHIDSYRYLGLQAEYIYKQTSGTAIDPTSRLNSDFTDKKSGFYLELIWRYQKHWRLGSRLDILNQGNHNLADELDLLFRAGNKWSAMWEYNPTEFSRIRLQYNVNRYQLDRSLAIAPVHELMIAVNIAIGAHGAHQF